VAVVDVFGALVTADLRHRVAVARLDLNAPLRLEVDRTRYTYTYDVCHIQFPQTQENEQHYSNVLQVEFLNYETIALTE